MKNRFTEEQIIKALKEHEGDRPTTDIVRELGIAEQTFYNWKRKYGDMNVSEVKRRNYSERKRKAYKEYFYLGNRNAWYQNTNILIIASVH